MNRLLLSLFMLFSVHLSAQSSVKPDVRLLEIYPEVKLNYIAENNPVETALLNFKLDNSYLIQDVSGISVNEKELEKVTINDVNNFNFLLLNIVPLNNERTYYLISGTSKVLIVKSDVELMSEFKAIFKK